MELQFGEELKEIIKIYKDGNDEPLEPSEIDNLVFKGWHIRQTTNRYK